MLSVPMPPGCHAPIRQTMVTTDDFFKFDRVQSTIDEKKKSGSTILSRLFLVYYIEMTHSPQTTQAYLASPKSNDKNGFFFSATLKWKWEKITEKSLFIFDKFFFYLVFDVESD